MLGAPLNRINDRQLHQVDLLPPDAQERPGVLQLRAPHGSLINHPQHLQSAVQNEAGALVSRNSRAVGVGRL